MASRSTQGRQYSPLSYLPLSCFANLRFSFGSHLSCLLVDGLVPCTKHRRKTYNLTITLITGHDTADRVQCDEAVRRVILWSSGACYACATRKQRWSHCGGFYEVTADCTCHYRRFCDLILVELLQHSRTY